MDDKEREVLVRTFNNKEFEVLIICNTVLDIIEFTPPDKVKEKLVEAFEIAGTIKDGALNALYLEDEKYEERRLKLEERMKDSYVSIAGWNDDVFSESTYERFRKYYKE